jgi:hypothetical protein
MLDAGYWMLDKKVHGARYRAAYFFYHLSPSLFIE